MHLCGPCEASRDWVNDPVVQTKIAMNAQQTDENRKARCATCRTLIRNPMFQICARCAEKARLCQRCSKPTESPEEIVAREASEARKDELIDLFTVAVKTYGLSASRTLFHEGMRGEIGDEAVEMLLLLDHREMDNGRERRPLWTKVLGPNVYRHRWCPECAMIPKRAPQIVKAAFCAHFTTGRSPALCPVCAAEKRACEGCGVSD